MFPIILVFTGCSLVADSIHCVICDSDINVRIPMAS